MSRWSLRRTGSLAYREYLRTQAWHWRRQHYFRDLRAAGFEPACQVCGLRLDEAGSLDLHHLSYAGISQRPDGSWVAGEDNADLMPLCRKHHREVHRLMDSGKTYFAWDRGRATHVVVAQLRTKYNQQEEIAHDAQ